MSLTAEPLRLPLATPFRIAKGTSTERVNVRVSLDGGLGEGALPPYYPDDLGDVLEALRAVDAEALLGTDPLNLQGALARLPHGPAPVRTALDLALHDRWARHLGQPLYRLWGLSPARLPRSSFTFGIPSDLDAFAERIAACPYPVLKLKLGTGDPEQDEAIVRTARQHSTARLCVDANGAWSVEEAAALIDRLADYDLLFVEQPLGTDDPAAWHALRDRLPADALPVVADESVQTADTIPPLAGAIDGVNVKLLKAGGLQGARRCIAVARALGLQVLVGCMVESSIAVTAAAHLAPLADYADLDAPVLLASDPYEGVTWDDGILSLPDRPGLGVRPRSA